MIDRPQSDLQTDSLTKRDEAERDHTRFRPRSLVDSSN